MFEPLVASLALVEFEPLVGPSDSSAREAHVGQEGFRIVTLFSSLHSLYEGDAASGAEPTCSYGTVGCIPQADLDGGHADNCPAWPAVGKALGYAQYEFGVLPEEYNDLVDDLDYLVSPLDGEDEDDVAIYTCTGCGSYGSNYGAEHACWRNADGTYEVGGSFQ